jgi:hypothetical protein
MFRLSVTLAAVVLAGCTIAGRIEHDVVDFNRAVEATSNEIAFSNILRSYKRMPRHYTAISTLQGNLEVVASGDISSAINPGRVVTDCGSAWNIDPVGGVIGVEN